MVMTEKKDIKSYNLDELKQELANMGEKPTVTDNITIP